MRGLLRIVFVWVLAAALPLQGIAAASMANCGPDHPGAAEAALEHRLPAAVHAPGETSAGHHHHHVRTDGGGSLDHKPAPAKPQTSKCSLCASCCTAAAVPSLALHIDAVSLPNFFAPSASIGVTAFLTTGQERPPRTFFV
jgi:hypothetical protein